MKKHISIISIILIILIISIISMIFIIYYNLDINKLNNNIRYNNYDIKLINYIKKIVLKIILI